MNHCSDSLNLNSFNNFSWYGPYQTNITKSYEKYKLIHIGKNNQYINDGLVMVLFENIIITGKYNGNGGVITGLSTFFRSAKLQYGFKIRYLLLTIQSLQYLIVTQIIENTKSTSKKMKCKSTFYKKQLQKCYMDLYVNIGKNDSGACWEPETDKDLCVAFGLLQFLCEFRYVSDIGEDTIYSKLNQTSEKPVSFVKHQSSQQLLVAVFLIKSSSYKEIYTENQCKVDVIFCWDDDELSRWLLPPKVVCLNEVWKKI